MYCQKMHPEFVQVYFLASESITDDLLRSRNKKDVRDNKLFFWGEF